LKKSVNVPLKRIQKRLPAAPQWLEPAHQGPGGLYAVRRVAQSTDHPPTYEVCRVGQRQAIGGPWMTPQGAHRFAIRLAEGPPEEAKP
jgi:hypothetical protein